MLLIYTFWTFHCNITIRNEMFQKLYLLLSIGENHFHNHKKNSRQVSWCDLLFFSQHLLQLIKRTYTFQGDKKNQNIHRCICILLSACGLKTGKPLVAEQLKLSDWQTCDCAPQASLFGWLKKSYFFCCTNSGNKMIWYRHYFTVNANTYTHTHRQHTYFRG